MQAAYQAAYQPESTGVPARFAVYTTGNLVARSSQSKKGLCRGCSSVQHQSGASAQQPGCAPDFGAAYTTCGTTHI